MIIQVLHFFVANFYKIESILIIDINLLLFAF